LLFDFSIRLTVVLSSGIETASFTGQSEEEINRLMHMVVVGGGPTGVEYAGELHDFLIVSFCRLP
jgi:NADH:ubiquinone reductase (non-electrogenic)